MTQKYDFPLYIIYIHIANFIYRECVLLLRSTIDTWKPGLGPILSWNIAIAIAIAIFIEIHWNIAIAIVSR